MQIGRKDFPELRRSELEGFAIRWITNYPGIPIEKITLYRYHSRFMDIYGSRYGSDLGIVRAVFIGLISYQPVLASINMQFE